MPIYSFKCEDHEEVHDKLLTFTEHDAWKKGEYKVTCPVCNKDMQKQISQANFVWNCSGSHNSEYSKYGRKK